MTESAGRVVVRSNRMRIDAVVFDMDGLMLDTEPLYKRAWQAAAADMGCVLDEPSCARLRGRPARDCEQELARQFGSAFSIDRFRAGWPEHWHAEAAARGIQRKPGLTELLAAVEAHGLPAAVATSSHADYAAFSLRHAGLAERFAIVVTGDEVARPKPAPDIYLEAARRLQMPPAACLALEDSEPGVLAACGAGMRALLIPDGAPPSGAAARAAFQVVDSLYDARTVIDRLVATRPADFEVRRATEADAAEIALAHTDSIRTLGARFYPPAVVDAWADGLDAELYVRAMRSGEVFYVATEMIAGRPSVLGFATHRADDAVDGTSVYVRGDAARRGIGTALLAEVERHARAHGATSLAIQASLAGVPFYKANGFDELGPGAAVLMSGVSMPCVHMRKKL